MSSLPEDFFDNLSNAYSDEDLKKTFDELFNANTEIDATVPIDTTLIEYIIILETFVDRTSKLNTVGIALDEYYFGVFTIIEDLMVKHYGEEVTDLILWYLFDRKTELGDILPYPGLDGNNYTFKNVTELYNYITDILPNV